MNEIKPCPFCGGKAEIFESGTGSANGLFIADFRCGCRKCGFYFKAITHITLKDGKPLIAEDGYETCKELWNRRAE